MERYATIDKHVGETPLEAAERLRLKLSLPEDVPLAYAGRLDPMASGTLLILIGDECKRQKDYHGLDKEYEFEVLFGISSDTADVLGVVRACDTPNMSRASLQGVTSALVGPLSLPYPHFSSKTVKGKPLHTWTLEGRLDEIEIPTAHSNIYRLSLTDFRMENGSTLRSLIGEKIESIPPVTDPKKALGNDFRRPLVRESWEHALEDTHIYTIATLRCTASSGTYMRSLAEEIAKRIGTCGLALSIKRTQIGRYLKLTKRLGFWLQTY